VSVLAFVSINGDAARQEGLSSGQKGRNHRIVVRSRLPWSDTGAKTICPAEGLRDAKASLLTTVRPDREAIRRWAGTPRPLKREQTFRPAPFVTSQLRVA
jgi:hypothetical protein